MAHVCKCVYCLQQFDEIRFLMYKLDRGDTHIKAARKAGNPHQKLYIRKKMVN